MISDATPAQARIMVKDSKIVVQCMATSFYFKAGDAWTISLDEAFDFGDLEKAARFFEERKLDPREYQAIKRGMEKSPHPRRKLRWQGHTVS